MKLLGKLIDQTLRAGCLIFCVCSIVKCGNVPVKPQVEQDEGYGIENAPTVLKSCVFNIYMENSGSMYGYVEGVTEFEQSVYSFLSDVKNSPVCAGMNLYYINNEIHQWQQSTASNDGYMQDDVRDFIDKLEPDTFIQSKGDKTTTDISDIIGNIFSQHGKDTVSVLISDFVFSPGSGKNAEEYLINQQIGIKNHLTKKLRTDPETGILLYRLTSKFEGKYFDRNNRPYMIKQRRPFFIMLAGDSEHLRQLEDNVPIDHIKGSGVLNTFSIENVTGQIPYEILVMPRIGEFRPDPAYPKTGIVNARIDKKNPESKFMLAVGVDYSGLILPEDYLTDSQNYEISNKSFTLKIEQRKKDDYTHILKLYLNPQLRQIPRGNVSVALMKRQSEWIENYTSSDDVGIENITEDKTYGLKYLVNGIYEAYATEEDYSKLVINIQ